MEEKLSIVIAGASGYIGKELIPRLLDRFPRGEIIALSRTEQKSDHPRLHWRACDLFSLKSLELAVPQKVDFAVYLVHSMGPTAQLDQGSFADYDLILADNFSRIMRAREVKHLAYLGGLIPEENKLSLHLQSRREVEQVFLEHSLPVTVFRAGLIIGEGGSSSQILIKLVKRLPVMICPQWTRTLTSPVDLESVLSALSTALGVPEHREKTYDLTGCRPLAYLEMMQITASAMGLKRKFLSVPFFTPTLSRLWVSLITNSSKDLVYPLIESLEHPMVARKSHSFPGQNAERSYRELLKTVSLRVKSGSLFSRFKARRKTVRSVQRLPLPSGKNALWVRERYFEWLPQFFSPFIRVRAEKTLFTFSFLGSAIKLLELELSKERSDENRQLLYIKGGLLVARSNRGRLEFRTVLGGAYVLAAIHDFRPALPWFIYKFTQAKIHLFVMNAFAKRLL